MAPNNHKGFGDIMKKLFKALACAAFLAAAPTVAVNAAAEDVSAPEAAAVTVLDEAPVTTEAAVEITTTAEAATTSAETTSTEAATTTADETTTAEAETTTYSDPNRIAVQDVQINATEADVEEGKTYKIDIKKIPIDATDNVVLKFISSDESIAKVDSNGVVTAVKPGTVTITVIADSMIPIIQDKTLESYTVLVLDNSTSMSGDPMTAQKEAAIRFCSETILSNTGTDYKFAVVSFGSSIQVATDFTNNLSDLKDTINGIRLTGSTNYEKALSKAAELLSTVSQNAVKNIVFCSDGFPNEGARSDDGPFTSADYSGYRYGNAAANQAKKLTEENGYNIYTLGFFHKIADKNMPYAEGLMNNIASSPTNSYIITDPTKLASVFSEVSNSVVNYNRADTFKKTVSVEVKPATAKTVKSDTTEVKKEETKSSSQDSPKTGDDNHNIVLISIIFIALAGATVTAKARRADK